MDEFNPEFKWAMMAFVGMAGFMCINSVVEHYIDKQCLTSFAQSHYTATEIQEICLGKTSVKLTYSKEEKKID